MTPTDLETLRGLLKDKLRDKTKGTRLAYLTDSQEEALTALLDDYERMLDKVPNASSVCPICGIATPHHHDAAEQAQYREKCKSDSLNQIRAVLPDDWKLVPASLIDWVMKLQHQKGCHPGIINTYDPLIYNDCTCGLDALRATLKGEKHE